MPSSDCPTDAELAAFAEGKLSGPVFDRMAAHLTSCADCQGRLERLDGRPDPVVAMLRRPPPRTEPLTSVSSSRPPRPDGRSPSDRPADTFATTAAVRPEDETRHLFYHRMRLGTPVLAAVLVVIVVVRLFAPESQAVQDPVRTPGVLVFLLLPAYATGLAVYLWLRPGASLSRLRGLADTFFGLCAAVLACRQFFFLAVATPAGFEGPGHAAAHFAWGNAASVLGWVLAIVNYGVLAPVGWRRVALAAGGLAAVSLATIVAAGVVNEELRPLLPYLLAWSAVLLLTAAATAVYASFQTGALRRAVSEARRLGPYELKGLLGTGGMGEVYLAEHRLLKRPCAVKLIRPEHAGDPDLLRRFEREVRATARLTHANTVAVYDYGHTDDGTFYYVMEYLPGPDLDELVRRHGPLPPSRAVHFLRQLCGALREAHAAGLVHRDVKPGNVIVCSQGGLHDVAKLLDFGLVRAPLPGRGDGRLTGAGVVLGTPDYMAPEQARGAESADARSDLYGLGALAYFLLTGQPPFRRASPLDTLVAHARDPVPPPTALRPDVPADLEAVVLRCLAKAPGDRYADAESLDAALARCACAGEWTEARAASWWRPGEACRPAEVVPAAAPER
jgi:serine/threonine-protein kinase